jgi:demethylspheroidene O-methyltransferase
LKAEQVTQPTTADKPAVTGLGLRERWLDQRDRWLGNPSVRDFASRFAPTRFIARRRARQLFDLVAGFVYSQWLAACVELQLFDRLAKSPMTAEQLAHEASLPLASAQRLLDAATALRLVQRRGSDVAGRERFGLGPLGVAMVGNDAVAALVRHHPTLYGDLHDPLALLRARGGGALAEYWSYAGANKPGELDAQHTGAYSALMAASQPLVAAQVLDRYPITRHHKLLDLGGGEGVFAAHALARAPKLQAVVFDLPSVVPLAQQRFERLGLTSRASAVGGDFHRDALPEGCDIVSLVRVIYDHDDVPALNILRTARRALPQGGTLLMAEPMAATAGAEPMGAAYFGMYLLAMGSGRSRSVADLTTLLQAAGFDQVRVWRTAVPLQTGLLTARAA